MIQPYSNGFGHDLFRLSFYITEITKGVLIKTHKIYHSCRDPAAFGLIFPKSETIFDLEFWKRWYNWLTLDNLKKLAAFVQSIVDKQLPEVVIAFVLTYIS